MVEALAKSPLDGFGLDAIATAIDDRNGVWVSEIPFLSYVSLRGNSSDAAFSGAVTSVTELALPIAPCSIAAKDGVKMLWISPDEWLIVCARTQHAALVAGLTERLGGIHSQVADNSGGYTQVILQGRNAKDVVQHVSVYNIADLHDGKVVGTTLGKASIYMHRQGNGYCLLLRRSFADYIWRFLVRASTPYGFGVAKLNDADRLRRGVSL
jgi:sarcosine oxidase, subunit gamma